MTDWNDAYANAPYVPGGAHYADRWAAQAAEFRAVEQAVGRAMLNLAYGPGPREGFDLFLPAGRPEGLVVFIHGGYWLKFDRTWFSHLAQGPQARGWAVAMPSYTLAPQARIAAITAQVARAVDAAAERVAGPMVIAGHSAGGHLAARMAAPEVGLAAHGRLRRVVPISPVADLRPMMLTAMNADLRIDAAEAEAESPTLLPRPPGVDVHVWVGGAERPAFVEQAGALARAWNVALTVDPDRHHFDIIEGLEHPDSPLTGALLDGA